MKANYGKNKSNIDWTPKMRKAMNDEINRQIVERSEKYYRAMDIIALYTLHKQFGFGKRRLKEFFDEFRNQYQHLQDYYMMPDDVEWVAEYKLKEAGIDIDEWYRELESQENSK